MCGLVQKLLTSSGNLKGRAARSLSPRALCGLDMKEASQDRLFHMPTMIAPCLLLPCSACGGRCKASRVNLDHNMLYGDVSLAFSNNFTELQRTAHTCLALLQL